MYSKTLEALEKFDNQYDFERMCADVLNKQGVKDVVLVAPRGGGDDGQDIQFTLESGGKGLACVTLHKDIERKFKEDFTKRKVGDFDKYILFCTAYLTAKQKKDFARYCLIDLDSEFTPCDIEALRSLLDSSLVQVREQYLHLIDDREWLHRRTVLANLRRTLIFSSSGITPGMMGGTDPLPKDWVETQLEKMGETWRQDIYY